MTMKQWLAIRKEAGIPKRLRLRGHSTLMRPPPTCRGQRSEAIGKTDGSLNSIYCSLTSAQIADRKTRLPNQYRNHRFAQQQQGASTDMPTNLWQPGESGNPSGRTRGSRNKLTEEVICALLRDFRQHGQKAVARVRQTQPAAYLKILALLVPREHKIERSNSIKDLTDEQLEDMIEYIKTSLEAQVSGQIKVIEGMIEPKTVPATALPVGSSLPSASRTG
jgi:hypothetical protein